MIKWYTSSMDVTKGPITAITALEAETSDWKNVNDQTYTMGTTKFGNADNAYTGCSAYNSCTTNTYTWPERTAKARMITMQEAADQGCTSTFQSCPMYMYGGIADNSNTYYWTMSTYISLPDDTDYYAWWIMYYMGQLSFQSLTFSRDIRLVIVINK